MKIRDEVNPFITILGIIAIIYLIIAPWIVGIFAPLRNWLERTFFGL